MRRSLRLAWAAVVGATSLVVMASTVLQGADGSQAAFGPVDIVRTTAQPVAKTFSFNVSPPIGSSYTLCLENGGHNRQYQPVTGGRVTLNGRLVFAPSAFKLEYATLRSAVGLQLSNQLVVEIASNPQSGLTLTIQPGATCAGGPPVNRPPLITSNPVTSATLLQAYSYQVVASDPDGDAVTYSLPTAPLGMSINPASGLISWTPPGTGTLNVGVRVTDSKNASTPQNFAVTAGTAANRPPHITAIPSRRIPARVPFQLELSADDPDPGDVVSFSLVTGPTGASIQDGRVLRWTPSSTNLGVNQFQLRATDRAGASDTGNLSIEVIASNGAPVLDALDTVRITAGSLYQRSITALDPDVNDLLTFSLAGGPTGLTIAPGGQLSWTPTTAQLGEHRVSVMVTDGSGLADAGAFAIRVDVPQVPQPPVARNDRYAVRIGTGLNVPPPGVLANDDDPQGRPLTAQLVSSATKGALNLASDGSFTYAPPSANTNGTAPALAYAYSYSDAGGTLVANSMQPLVADLDKDGKPEIVHLSVGTFADRRLIAVHGDTGTTAWVVNAYQPTANPRIILCFTFCEMALGDLDNDGSPEIVAIHSDEESGNGLRRRLIAFNANGSYRWTSDDILSGGVTQTTGMFRVAIADLDGDGRPEIVTVHAGKTTATPSGVISEDLVTVFNSDGHIRWTVRVPGRQSSGRVAVADIDVDGVPDIVIGGAVLDPAGNIRWNSKASIGTGSLDIAIGNLDDDPYAEIVYTDNFQNLYRFEHTGTRTWGGVKNPTFSDFSGVAIGDADGDGRAEILMGRDNVEVWSPSGTFQRSMSLPSGMLGYGGIPTIFDLNGDGRPEVLYNGARSSFDTGPTFGALYIFDGPSGTLLHSVKSTRNGGYSDVMPLVADVTGDGSAEIVTGGWNEQAMLHVFKAAAGSWMKTRPIWSGTAYHVTDIESDGRVPAHEAINWLTPGLNNFRVNVPLPSERTDERDQFTYVASNGAMSSNVATVQIDILPPNTAPRILSTAPTSAAPGLEYLYAVRAVDPDAGELITFSLPVFPAGMTIDPTTGLIRWTPSASASGSIVAVVKATDTQGESSSQSFAVTLSTPAFVPTVVGGPLSGAPAVLTGAGLALGSVTASPSSSIPINTIMSQEPLPGSLVATGSAVDLVVSSGPAPVAVPYLIGRTESDAVARLTTLGLGNSVTRAFSNTVPAGRVTNQTPSAGTPLVPGSVALTVSAGSGLRLLLQRSLTTADATIPLTAVAYDLQFVESPAPALSYSVIAAKLPSFGALPTVVGNAIVPNANTRGAFRVTATDASTGRSVSADFAVVAPNAPGKRSMNDVFAGVSLALSDIEGLIRQGRTALAVGNTTGVASVLQQIVSRWRQVDRKELRLATPFGLPDGFFPTAADIATLSLTPTADDLLALEVLDDADDDLRAWIAGLRAPSTTMASLNALADRFNTRASRLSTLTLSEWGAIRARPLMNALVADRIPELYSAIIDEVAAALAKAAPGGPSTLAEVVVTTAMEYVVDQIAENLATTYKNAKQFTTDILVQAAWSTAIVTAAHHFREFTQATDITAVVAGASLSFHLFEAPWSWIEADVDADEADNSLVVTVGPDVLYAVLDAIDKIKSVTKFGKVLDPNAPKDDGRAKNMDDLFDGLKALHEALKGVQSSAENVVQQVKNAFQPTGQGLKGCVFSSSPTCGQLVYEDGINSVYHYSPPDGFQSFTGLPVPILFLVYNRTTGGVQIATPVFLPTPLP
jgi:hypothetical protein